MTGNAERPRLRELRTDLGWTQQQLADNLAQLAWTHDQGHAAVNADMVAGFDATGVFVSLFSVSIWKASGTVISTV